MRTWIIITIIFCLVSVSVETYAFKVVGSRDLDNFTGRAVSLKVLQEKLEHFHETGDLPSSLYHLCGITTLFGYVVDEDNRDVILFGTVEKNLPPLYLDDFVVALRNAWMKYTKVEGNTRYYSNPGCSIDPNPQTLRELEYIGNQISNSQGEREIEMGIRKWQQACTSPQKVRVLGVPFDTHFASVMVKADYHMKKIVDGSDDVNLIWFNSLLDIDLEEAKERFMKGKEPINPGSSLNRFWFYPGKNTYLEDEGGIFIDSCEVKLLTEEEHVNASGQARGIGRANPNAKKFVEEFSASYSSITVHRPIFYELENLYRFVALVKILKYKAPHLKVGLNLDYLLDRYQVEKVKVSETLPGRSHVKRSTYKKNNGGSYQTYQVWFPICGGVEMNLDVGHKNFKKGKTHGLKKIKENTIKEKFSSNQLFWNFGKKPEEIHILIKRKRKVRSPQKNDSVVATIGDLYVNGEYFCKTLELPFKNNANKESSVPVGTYNAAIRYSRNN